MPQSDINLEVCWYLPAYEHAAINEGMVDNQSWVRGMSFDL